MSNEIATVFVNELSFNNRKLTSVTKSIVKAWKNCKAVEAEAVEAEAVEAEAVEAEAVDACEMALQNILNGIATLKADIRFADCNEQFNLIEQQIKKIEEKF